MQGNGWKLRLYILRRDCERKLLDPLRTHVWATTIEREEGTGEFLIFKAERAGISRKASLLYSSATANEVYKRLDEEVDVIIFNGQPYLIDSFAHGVNKPVVAADEFYSILVDWNRISGLSKLGPVQTDFKGGKNTKQATVHIRIKTAAVLCLKVFSPLYRQNRPAAFIKLHVV